MTTQSVSHRALHANSSDSDFDVRVVTELVATVLSGLHRVNDQFVFMNATLSDDGYIHVNASRVCFAGDNSTVRVLLYPTEPMSVSSQFTPEPKSAG
jgi:hypothetical protein